jgi:hypothetical protein
MASEMTEQYSLGVGRLSTGIMAHDDTVFLIGGAKPNTTLGLNSIWTSYDASVDATKPTYLSLLEADKRSVLATSSSTTDFVLTSSTVKMYFSEAVTLATLGAVEMVDTAATAVKIAISTSISRQVLTIAKASGVYTAGKTMRVSIAASSLKDPSGNTLSAAVSQDFTLDADNTAPAVSGMHPAPGSADIVPWTTLTLTFAETVNAVSGVVNVTSTLGRNITLDVAEAKVVNNKLFWDLGEARRLTDATTYKVSVPAGMVRDAAFNLNGAHSSYAFTTLSGNHSFNNYINSTTTVSEPITVLNANDTAKPTFVSMYPPVSATDVKCGGEVSVFMFFNEPVKWNETGMIYIVNSSNKVTGTINITHDRVVASTRSLAHVENGTKLSVGSFLKKGVTFTVSIPAGVIDDLNNLPIDEVKQSFTCLAEKADYGPPEIAVINPWKDRTGVPSTSYQMTAWFSENIKAATGSITLKKGSTVQVTSITSSNVTISGPKLDVTLSDYFKGPDNSEWQVIIPAGTVTDARGNFFGGIATSDNQKFKVSLVDTTAPTIPDLATVKPEKETTMGYAKGLSSSIEIPFSEYIKKGTGHIKASMKYMKKDWTMDVSSLEVTIVGSTAIVTPNIDWTPGEIYSVKIDAGAFTDLAGNAFAGLTTGWTISTKQLINFRAETPSTAGDNFFDNLDYFDGSRYAASAVFDSTNNLYVIGGRNGTLGGSSQLNDVWTMATKKEVHCSSSIQPMFECTSDANEPSLSNAVTSCMCPSGGCNAAKTDAYAGSKKAITQVWKTSTPGGRQCMQQGMPNSLVGTILFTANINCPCPKCKDAPFNLSATNPEFNAIPDYTYGGDLPIVGHNGTLPLTCATGYEASKDFTCQFQDLYTAVYETPYPRCVKSPCRTAPVPLANSVMECTVPKGDMETCSYTCLDGYGVNNSVYSGTVTCDLGTFIWDQPTACTKLPTTTTTTPGPSTKPQTAPSTTPPNTTTPKPVTVTKVGETVIEILKVATSMILVQTFPEGTTGASLLADTGYVDSIETGLATGLGDAYTKEMVTVLDFTLGAAAPAATGNGTRRLGEARRLPEMSLQVDYEIEVKDAAAAANIQAVLADPEKRAAFTNSFVAAYTAAEADKGRTVEGLTVTQSASTTVKTEKRIVAAPTTPPPAPGPAPAPAPGPAPAPAPAAEEEEEGGSAGIIGGVVGGIAGIAILGGIFYMYKKKASQE